jgi:flagellar motor switch/type III secretory pathway protein FliN
MASTAKTEKNDDGWSMSGRRERSVMEVPVSDGDEQAGERKFPTGRGVLSADEIAALLRPDLSDLDEIDEPASPATISAAATPDFAVPQQETFDRQTCEEVVSRLSMALRHDCEFEAAITLGDTRSCAFREAMTLAQPGWVTAFLGDKRGQIAGAILLSPGLASAFIEDACGGTSGIQMPMGSRRTLTPVDAALLGNLLAPLAKAVRDGLSIMRIETDARYSAPLAPPVGVTLMQLSVMSGDQTTEAALVLSQPSVQASQAIETTIPGSVPRGVTAAVTARIATLSVPVSRLSDLKPGSTLLLGIPADQPIELLSGGRNGELVAEGEIGRKGNRMAIKINRRGPVLLHED